MVPWAVGAAANRREGDDVTVLRPVPIRDHCAVGRVHDRALRLGGVDVRERIGLAAGRVVDQRIDGQGQQDDTERERPTGDERDQQQLGEAAHQRFRVVDTRSNPGAGVIRVSCG